MKNIKIVNLTQHVVRLADAAGQIVATIEPSGEVARMVPHSWQESPRVESGLSSNLPVEIREHQSLSSYEIAGLPLPADNTVYLVSLLCLDAAQQQRRGDVYAPATGPADGAIRSEDGQIYAVRRLVRAYTPTYR